MHTWKKTILAYVIDCFKCFCTHLDITLETLILESYA